MEKKVEKKLPLINTFQTYNVKLPCSGQILKYRPITAKEQISLLEAKESGEESDIFEAVKNIIGECVLSDVDIDSLSVPDFEFLMLKIRSSSVSGTSKVSFICNHAIDDNEEHNCKETIKLEIKLDDARLDGPLPDKIVKLSDDIALELRGVTFGISAVIANEGLDIKNKLMKLISDMIVTLWYGDDMYEMKNYSEEERIRFVENLTSPQLQSIIEYIRTYPSMVIDVDFTCPKCGTEHHIELKGLTDFFG